MSKNYVVLEFESNLDLSTNNIDWHSLLFGAVTVTNWRDITEQKLQDVGKEFGVGQVLSSFDGMTAIEAYNAISDCVYAGQSIINNDDIVIYEPFEHLRAEEILDAIDNFSESYVIQTKQLLQIED
jgi:hypothetical protein